VIMSMRKDATQAETRQISSQYLHRCNRAEAKNHEPVCRCPGNCSVLDMMPKQKVLLCSIRDVGETPNDLPVDMLHSVEGNEND
jgi:hypothetical protein